jgi:hypothetical protein
MSPNGAGKRSMMSISMFGSAARSASAAKNPDGPEPIIATLSLFRWIMTGLI